MAAEMIEREYSDMKNFVCVLLCLALMLCALPVLAVSQSEIDALEEQRDALEEKRDNISHQLDSMEGDMERQLERKSALDEESALLAEDIGLLNEQIDIYEVMVSEKRLELQAAEAQEEAHFKLYLARVRDMEEHSSWTYLSYVLDADSISELISRIADISDIMGYDETLRRNYLAACERTQEILREYELMQSAAQVKQLELLAQQTVLDEKIEESSAIIRDLENDIEAYKEYLDAADEDMERVQAEIDEKAEELRKQKAAEEAAKKPVYQAPVAPTISSGYYMWPSATTYITSPFGPRVHPIYGVLKPHTGVDIGAWYGTEIYAAAEGTVTAAVLDFGTTGYGSYVAIYHPNGSTTLYAHMSALAVNPGQYVSKGQVIGYVGSTGASNGPHIHYEIRVNGACVDPMLYY